MYLYGGGKPVTVFDDPIWTDYMTGNNGLRLSGLERVKAAVMKLAARGDKGRFAISNTFHAECPENSGFSK